MKVVIQNKGTLKFFAGDNLWVDDIHQAMSFEHSVAAKEQCMKEGLCDIHVLIHVPGGRDVIIHCDCYKK